MQELVAALHFFALLSAEERLLVVHEHLLRTSAQEAGAAAVPRPLAAPGKAPRGSEMVAAEKS